MGFIRTGGSIPPRFYFLFGWLFPFFDHVGFIWTVVFQKCLVMFLEGGLFASCPYDIIPNIISTTSNPCGFYSDRGFANGAIGAFIRSKVFISPLVGFIWTVVFTTLPETISSCPLLQSGREE